MALLTVPILVSASTFVRALGLAALLALALPLRGLTVRPPRFDELVTSAETVVRGEVVTTRSHLRMLDGQPVPFTLVTLRVEETLKGKAGSELTLHCLGGVVGDEALHIVGAPEFVEGDRGFFFIQRNGTQFIPLVAVAHGVYWLVRDPNRGEEVVVRGDGLPLQSLAQISTPLRGERKTALAAGAGAMTATEFARTIRREVSNVRR